MKRKLFRIFTIFAMIAVGSLSFSYASQCVMETAGATEEQVVECCNPLRKDEAAQCKVRETAAKESATQASTCPYGIAPASMESYASGVATTSVGKLPTAVETTVRPQSGAQREKKASCPRAESKTGREVLSQESKLLI